MVSGRAAAPQDRRFAETENDIEPMAETVKEL
jgi:hypothetical protein